MFFCWSWVLLWNILCGSTSILNMKYFNTLAAILQYFRWSIVWINVFVANADYYTHGSRVLLCGERSPADSSLYLVAACLLTANIQSCQSCCSIT